MRKNKKGAGRPKQEVTTVPLNVRIPKAAAEALLEVPRMERGQHIGKLILTYAGQGPNKPIMFKSKMGKAYYLVSGSDFKIITVHNEAVITGSDFKIDIVHDPERDAVDSIFDQFIHGKGVENTITGVPLLDAGRSHKLSGEGLPKPVLDIDFDFVTSVQSSEHGGDSVQTGAEVRANPETYALTIKNSNKYDG